MSLSLLPSSISAVVLPLLQSPSTDPMPLLTSTLVLAPPLFSLNDHHSPPCSVASFRATAVILGSASSLSVKQTLSAKSSPARHFHSLFLSLALITLRRNCCSINSHSAALPLPSLGATEAHCQHQRELNHPLFLAHKSIVTATSLYSTFIEPSSPQLSYPGSLQCLVLQTLLFLFKMHWSLPRLYQTISYIS
ncbi:hypothetical protein PIB30_022133 [Stylosanthes scabra]|uniref:Uncharacterized protein n=1 Tax=Stylosanthes scabra TaxID=79078 RepID=A0ABU6U879_9FABA|nr:hypothetical protein [Stylosanthes scabra]